MMQVSETFQPACACIRMRKATPQSSMSQLQLTAACVHVTVNANNLPATSEWTLTTLENRDHKPRGTTSWKPPLRPLHVTYRASSCAKRGGHVQLCLKPRGHAELNPRPSGEAVSFCVLHGESYGGVAPPTKAKHNQSSRQQCVL